MLLYLQNRDRVRQSQFVPVVVLFALRQVNIPLTLFAFLGGALVPRISSIKKRYDISTKVGVAFTRSNKQYTER